MHDLTKIPLVREPLREARRQRKVPYGLHGSAYELGKDELLSGRRYLHSPPYAEEPASNGRAGLCIDSWVFGQRSHTSESDTFKSMLWQGRVLRGTIVHDSLRAVDHLTRRANVDPQRIAALSMSMGSTMSRWLGALDERLSVTGTSGYCGTRGPTNSHGRS